MSSSERWGLRAGFTIVELLVVIVVIAVLAAVSTVAFTGLQERSRNAQRQAAVNTITKALEAYYAVEGHYPDAVGSTLFNVHWSTTGDNSWANLRNVLVPKYISELPTDPQATAGIDFRGNTEGYGFAYYANNGGSYCGAQRGQMYLLVYRLEGAQKHTFLGNCSGTPLSYSASTYRVVK